MKNFLSAKTTASWLALLFKLMILVLGVLLPFRLAEAVPSFARQTGATCSQCHVQGFGPNLTPMGRQFKLEGYTFSLPGQSFAYPPLSAMVQGSFTHTDKGQPGGAAPDFGENDNFSFDQASLFWGGRVIPGFKPLGAFVQLTYDGIGDTLSLDNTDIRFANTTKLASTDLVYGVSFNNNPT